MIKTHKFNTRWWGKPNGIVTDHGFFHLPEQERARHLEPFEWVEFRMPLENAPVALASIHRSGFFQVDTQINYRLGLKNLSNPPSLAELDIEFADETPFEITADAVKSFDHERFFRLPGITPERANQRYALWSAEHIPNHPTTSLRILYKGQVEGWYLADDTAEAGLNLTLGMLSKNSSISGLLVFLKAYHAFAGRGYRMGWASFSVNNTAVHNIYVAVGAHFLSPVGYWLWLRD